MSTPPPAPSASPAPTLAARLLVAILLTLTALAGWYAGQQTPASSPPNTPGPSATAARPATTPASLWQARFTDPQGQSVAASSWQGRPVLINFWATWCPPCREEMPALAKASHQHPEVRFIGIGIDTEENIRAFNKHSPQPYPLLIGGETALPLSQALGNQQGALPFTVLIDAQGRIQQQHLGALSPEALAGWLSALPPSHPSRP